MSPVGYMPPPALPDQARAIIEACREPMGLDRWSFRMESAEGQDFRGSCEARPEYREAIITFDFDKFETGDELAEIVVHEMTHCLTWELHTLAEEIADALAESAPKGHRRALRKLLHEKVRQAGERTTTDVGHALLRLLRRANVLDKPATEVA